MKKIFISILSAAIFAACAKTETEDITPISPEPEDEAQTVYVEIGATTGSDTKATYDENLKAYWEAGDQILAIQGSATNKTYNFPSIGSKDFEAETNVLSLNDGEMTNTAKFIGDITVYDSDNNRYFHFAYPAGQSQMKTNTHIPYGQSSVSTDYKTTTTCSYTVPSEQDGKWTPFLCTSTADKTTAANITNIDFGTSRNACFAVRVYESDKTTPKKIKSITIVAENNIVGTISATTDNDGSFAGKEFEIVGGGNTITADNLQSIETLNNLYEYRFEVLPIGSGKISLTVTDESGSVITRTANAKTFKANTRSGVNVYWDAAGISMDATTWFEDSCAKNELSALSSANTIYCDVTLFGIGAADIQKKGVIVNGTEYDNNDSSNKFSSEIAATNGNGEYTVQAYAVLNDGTRLESAEQTVYVVDEKVLPAITAHTIRSSYNMNDSVDKTNDINGDLINANVSLNDCWASNNLIESVTLVYDGFNASMTGDTNLAKSVETSVASRAYKNTHIEVKFSNGYVISTPYYTINVTGIPYYWINSETSVKGGSNGETISGTGTFFIPTGTLTANVVYNVVIGGGTIATTGTLTVGNQQIFSTKSPSGFGNTKTTTIEGYQDITITTGSIDYSYKNSYGLGNTKSTVYKIGIEY